MSNNDTKNAKKLLEYSQYFKMADVCERAGVNYGTFRNWKSNPEKYALNDEAITKLLNTIKEISKQIK